MPISVDLDFPSWQAHGKCVGGVDLGLSEA
jgi:hypothetical protein